MNKKEREIDVEKSINEALKHEENWQHDENGGDYGNHGSDEDDVDGNVDDYNQDVGDECSYGYNSDIVGLMILKMLVMMDMLLLMIINVMLTMVPLMTVMMMAFLLKI